ncbi:RNA methyltransferase [Butyricimonas sp.]|uniref:methyltransferase RsmF C-terminal domain-like protein n=1 Tax=Butyricimonas sp. TaxID=1969738 RepID=UPI0025BD4D93|nr:RNA methyltransferase [Butyricimonas sp.]
MISLPPAFIERMNRIMGNESEVFFEALNSPSPATIRVNPAKTVTPLPFPELIDGQVPWCSDAYYLRERPVYTLDPYLHGGVYYVQEASSMFLQYVFRQIAVDKPLRVLDLCAAPGGKSTLLAANLPTGSLLVSNEVIKSRASILKENIIKWGYDNIVVTNSDPARFSGMKGAFDIILVDAPCSGEGMFRKDEKAIEEWSENNLRLCEERQKRIIADIWDALAPEGYLVYSTCTYNPGENEDMFSWVLDNFEAESVEVQHDYPGIIPTPTSVHGYHFYPHKSAGEGLFMGVIRKKDGQPFTLKKGKRSSQNQPPKLPTDILPLLPDIANHTPYLAGSTLGIIPARHAEFIQYLESKAGVIYKGCEIGESVKGTTRPAHSLALLHNLQKQHITRQEVDLPTALQYLRKEDIRFDAPRGAWILIMYQGIALGWVKEAGNRLNNYYPKEWRIKRF